MNKATKKALSGIIALSIAAGTGIMPVNAAIGTMEYDNGTVTVTADEAGTGVLIKASADGVSVLKKDVTVNAGTTTISDVTAAAGDKLYLWDGFENIKPLTTVLSVVNKFTVTFKNGEETVSTAKVVEGEKASKPETDPTKDGYIFQGWYLGDTEYNFDTPITGDITLEAKFKSENIIYELNVKSCPSGDITKKAATNDEISACSVSDFGVGTDKTPAVLALDGWGYTHWGYTAGLTEGRQTSAHITAAENAVYAQGVGNSGSNSILSFIPANVDGMVIPENGVLIYKFDAIVTTTGGNAPGSPVIGFTKSSDGAVLDSVAGVNLAATGINNQPNKYAMTLAYDMDNDKYAIYTDSVLAKEGTDADITGIYAQQNVAKYIKIGVADLTLEKSAQMPKAAKLTFKGDADVTLKEYASVLSGAKMEAPDVPSVSGKTFREWQNSDGEAVTEFVVGETDTVYTAIYDEGSTISTVDATVNGFAKVTIQSEDADPIVLYSAADGKVSFKDIPQGEYTYTISKTGYTDKTGTFTLGIQNYELIDAATLTDENKDYIYYESDWLNGSKDLTNGANTDGNSRGVSTNLAPAPVVLPSTDDVTDVYTVHIAAGVGTWQRDNSVSTWILKTSGGKDVLGIQWSKKNGVFAFTGWGTEGITTDKSDGAFTNKVKLIEPTDTTTGRIEVDFTVNSAANSITVNYGGKTVGSLPIVNDATTLESMEFGVYREKCDTHIYELSVKKPDVNFLALSGDTDFAKISGQTVSKTYTKAETVVDASEEFDWTLSRTDGKEITGITITDGVLTVGDTAEPGVVTIACASKTNDKKKATIDVTIGDFQKVTLIADGPQSYEAVPGNKGIYKITSAKDTFGDEVIGLIPTPVWTSSNTDVATVNATTGELTVVAAGKTDVKATVTNGTEISEITIPVTVATYSITQNVTENSTVVDISALVTDDAITGYQATTATADGIMVKSTTVAKADVADNKITVDTTDAAKVEINPVYEATNIASADSRYTFKVPSGAYNITVTMSGSRADLYVNKQLVVNNMLQYCSKPDATDVMNDVVINEGYAEMSTTDYSSGKSAADTTVSELKIVKSPSIVTRKPKIYVMGDSLVAKYYEDAGTMTGWGQVLQNYIADDMEVVNIANSGADVLGIIATQMTRVLTSAQPGDYMVLESGYNDKGHNIGTDVMKDTVKKMVADAEEKGVNVVLVSPNASAHDYGATVAWSDHMKAAAEESNTDFIDLSKLSYEFLYGRYGAEFTTSADNENLRKVYNIYRTNENGLHSTVNAANCWAAIVATELGKLGITTTDYSYTFNDGTNDITVSVDTTVSADTPAGE